MKITFIGGGYVGLVSAVMSANFGHAVTCIDTDEEKILKLQSGSLSIYEKDLERYLHNAIKLKGINFKSQYDNALSQAEIIFIAVGTPSLEDGNVNLEYVREATLNALKFASEDALIVIKSTVPPGTCNSLQKLLHQRGYNNEVASNPEFLREGDAVSDYLNPHRVIIGSSSSEGDQKLRRVYDFLSKKDVEFLSTDTITAEMIKYSSNSYLAIKIAFINEMANLCEATGANIDNLSSGLGLDPRIGKEFLKCGPGFGGSCFPKDILGFSRTAKQNKVDSYILNAAIKANKQRPIDMVLKIKAILGNLEGLSLSILGLSFKAGTDDVRDSPAIEVIKILIKENVNLIAYDPKANEAAKRVFPNLNCANSLESCIRGANAIIILTEWSEFKTLESSNTEATIIDLRNLLDPSTMKFKKSKYYSLGR